MAKYNLTVKEDIDIAHRLMYHKGKCKNLHGHRLEIEVSITSRSKEKNGITIDYGDIKNIIRKYDHSLLINENDEIYKLLYLKNIDTKIFSFDTDPTTETIAEELEKDIYKKFPSVSINYIQIKESKNNILFYIPK